MKDLRDLKSDKEHHLRCAEDILKKAEADERALSESEQKDSDVHLAEIVKIDAEIEEVVKHQRHKESLASVREQADAVATRKAQGIPAETMPGVVQAKTIEFPNRFGANLQCFKGTNGPEEAYKFGTWLGANILKRQFYQNKWREIQDSSRALSETDNSAGGALVPTQFADFIINLREEFGIFEQEAFTWPMTSDKADVPRINGRMSASIIGEGSSITESDLEFGNVVLVAKKGAIITFLSNELSEDSLIEIADLIATEMGHEFAEQIDNSGFNGDGSASFGGILGVANRIEGETSAKAYVNATSGTDTFAKIDAEDLSNVKAVVADSAHRRGNAKWYVSRAGFELVFSRLQQASGGNTKRDTADGPIQTYDGNDVVISQVLETSTGTVNDTALLLFGDLRQAAILGRRRAIDIAVDGSFRFQNDQTAIRAIQRFDVSTVPEIEETASDTVTPFAALIGNT